MRSIFIKIFLNNILNTVNSKILFIYLKYIIKIFGWLIKKSTSLIVRLLTHEVLNSYILSPSVYTCIYIHTCAKVFKKDTNMQKEY